jgi:hypothetical protein
MREKRGAWKGDVWIRRVGKIENGREEVCGR